MLTMYSAIRRISLVSGVLVGLLVTAVQAAPGITNPAPGSTLTTSTVTFTGGHASAGEGHWVYVGSSPGGNNFFANAPDANHQFTVSGLPATGMIYVKYYSRPTITSAWETQTDSYTMNVGGSGGGSGGGGDLSAEILAQIAILNDKLDEVLAKDVDLRGVTQNWDKKLPADDGTGPCDSSRFTCVFGDTAVRDNETGIVWERSPRLLALNWAQGISYCANREVGGRKGWSLPMVEQLASLVDPSNQNPAWPTGHPFSNAPFDYWSATTNANDPSRAWTLDMASGLVRSDVTKNEFEFTLTWCVRGGQAYDGQDVLEVLEKIDATHP